jgi:membrane-bound lytic murein transglycosylase D
MPDMNDQLVRNHEQWYRSRPDYVQRMTERGSRYLYHIVEEVTRRGMPSELALLPFIESAYNPQAMSSAKASGMWQFIPSTGRNFDLKQNVFRDDRRDVLASTRAALDYLSKLYGMFGDWRLALAAYNWGEGNVGKAIARNQRARKPTRYEDLRMPAETRNYLPKLQAVKNIVSAPEKFGLTLPDLRNHPYFLSVPLYRDIDVDLAAELALIDVEEFRTLNPSMDKPVILAAGTPQVLLPYDNADEFVRNLAAYTGPLASWTAWQVSRTLKPADAAKLIGVSEDKLRSVNHIPQRMLIKAGSVLLVPRDDDHQGDVSEHMAEHAQMVLQPDGPLLRRVAYRTARGDTLAGVARRYRVAPADLAQWNKLGASAPLNAGQQLVIYVPSVTTKVARAAGPRKRGAHAATTNVRSKANAKAPAKSTNRAASTNRAGSATPPRTASTTPPATR